MPLDPAFIDTRPTEAQVRQSLRGEKCLRHPEQRLEVQIERETGRYIPWCTGCLREGYSKPKLAPVNAPAERLGTMVGQELPAVREVITLQPAQPQRPMTIAEFDERMALIKHVVQQMDENIHYGVIPGTSDKSLWEPGAEYLRAAFNIGWSYEMLEELEDYEKMEFRYRVRAFTLDRTGTAVAEWTASAWSKERKFWCKGGEQGCPKDCDQKHRPRGMEPGMLPHNVRDRAIKRAFVALMRNVTGTTGYFKQALDSMGSDNGTLEPGQLPQTYPCPECQGTMRLRQGKYGPYYSHKKGNGWHNLDADKVGVAPVQAQDSAQDDQDGPSEPAGVVGVRETPQAPAFRGTTLVDLWNYGISIGFKGGKAACLTALHLKDDALIANLDGAASELARISRERQAPETPPEDDDVEF